MTDKEHALMIRMFTRQNLYIQMLLDMLQSRGIIEKSDVPVFDFAVIKNPDNSDAFDRAITQYRSFANQLGLAVPETASLFPDKT